MRIWEPDMHFVFVVVLVFARPSQQLQAEKMYNLTTRRFPNAIATSIWRGRNSDARRHCRFRSFQAKRRMVSGL